MIANISLAPLGGVLSEVATVIVATAGLVGAMGAAAGAVLANGNRKRGERLEAKTEEVKAKVENGG